MRLGILGGTFNPPHLGHLICAQEAYVQLALEHVLLVPAGEPPHKAVAHDPGRQHRLELTRRAVAGDPRFSVSELEVMRAGPSYTVDTLEQLIREQPGSELFLIVGGDAAVGLPRWREPERLLDLATPAVATRPGTAQSDVRGALLTLSRADQARFFAMPEIAISSSMVRERVQHGEPIRFMVPDAVLAYIERHQLYGGED